MKAASLFSGIGAPEVAMPSWAWLWHAEIEPFARAVMAARHPQSVNLGDVTHHGFVGKAAARGRADVLIFGSPCQSFSVAGQRLGLDDPRGNLALVALGIVARLAPRWFVFENVPGLLSSAEGRDFGLFLRAVDDIGYRGGWTVLDAQHFGLAQRRERLFFVGHAGDWRRAAAVLFEPEGLRRDHPPGRAAGERIAPTIEARATAGGAGWGTDFLADGGMAEMPDLAWALQERDAKGPDSSTKDGHLIVFKPSHFTRGKDGAPAGSVPPLSADADKGDQDPLVQIAGAVRRLTPRECERLMGFADDYTLVRYRGKVTSDSPRYRALGNSMAVPVVRWILQRIEAMEEAQ